MRKGFTLIELMISIVILSIMMLYLYETYSSLNISNSIYGNKTETLKGEQLKQKVIYLDMSLSLNKSIQILNQDKEEDVLFMQSSHSLHKRHNPYIAYILKEKKLYRLESLKPFVEYPLGVDSDFVVDYMGEIDSFRVYKNSKKVEEIIEEIYLVHIDFKREGDILLKVKVLNEY